VVHPAGNSTEIGGAFSPPLIFFNFSFLSFYLSAAVFLAPAAFLANSASAFSSSVKILFYSSSEHKPSPLSAHLAARSKAPFYFSAFCLSSIFSVSSLAY